MRLVLEFGSYAGVNVAGASFFVLRARALLRLERGRRLSLYERATVIISVALVSDAKSRRINTAFRKHARSATTLSFPFVTKPRAHSTRARAVHLGEIIIAPSIIKTRARAKGISFRRELTRHFAHAMLHLLGYNHEGRGKKFLRDEKIMERFENKIVARFNR